MDEPDALSQFEFIYRHAHVAGRLYALSAFTLLDAARASSAAAELRRLPDEVLNIEGCEYDTDPVEALVHRIESDQLGKLFRDNKSQVYKCFESTG